MMIFKDGREVERIVGFIPKEQIKSKIKLIYKRLSVVIIMRYDIAIVGSGPAGLSAAINAKIRNKNIIVFGTENLSNKLKKHRQ